MAGTLTGTLPELQAAERKLRAYAMTRGVEYIIADYGGWRSQADTAQLIKWRDDYTKRTGKTYPVAPFGKGYHGKGAAFDIKVIAAFGKRFDKKGTLTKAEVSARDLAYKTLGAQASAFGLTWGGTFKGTSNDPYHFQLAITLAEAAKRFDKLHGTNTQSASFTLPAANSAPQRPVVKTVKTGQTTLSVVAALAVVALFFFCVV